MTLKTGAALKAQFKGYDPNDHNADVVDFANAGGRAVAVTDDWATAAHAAADILAGIGLAPAETLTLALILWEGSADADDYAVLNYTDSPAYAVQFASAPTTGWVYIVGAQYTALGD